MFNQNEVSTHNFIEVLVGGFKNEKSKLIQQTEQLASIKDSFMGISVLRTANINYASSLDLDQSIGLLKSHYWMQVYSQSKIETFLSTMDQEEFKKSFSANSDFLPEFNLENVHSTLHGWHGQVKEFFINRVDSVFQALSPDHVTNSPKGFRNKLIFKNYVGYVLNDDECNLNDKYASIMHDLRCCIAVSQEKEAPKREYDLFKRMPYGVIQTFDNGAFKMKCFKNGNVHIWLHDEVALDLNFWLAQKYPTSIPDKEHRKSGSNSSQMKKFNYQVDCLLGENFDFLASFQRKHSIDRFRDATALKYLGYSIEQLIDIRLNNEALFTKLVHAFSHLCRNGVPNVKSNQFYPTPANIVDFIADYLKLDNNGDFTILEPSAGNGSLALIQPDKTHAYEVSSSLCAVLEAKSVQKVINEDFLSVNPNESKAIKYDYVLINPPYSEGRWKLHIEHALRFMKNDGEMVAIIPEGYGRKLGELHPELSIELLTSFDNAFDDTAIKVSVFSITRR